VAILAAKGIFSVCGSFFSLNSAAIKLKNALPTIKNYAFSSQNPTAKQSLKK